jgi:hypothetical protein
MAAPTNKSLISNVKRDKTSITTKTLVCASAAATGGGKRQIARIIPQCSLQPGSSLPSAKSHDDRHPDQTMGLSTTDKQAEMKQSRRQSSAVSVGSIEAISARTLVIKRGFHDSCYSAIIESTNINSQRSTPLKTAGRVNIQHQLTNTKQSRLSKLRQQSPPSLTSVATAELRGQTEYDEQTSAAATDDVVNNNRFQTDNCDNKTMTVILSGSESDLLSNVKLLSLTGSQCSLSADRVRRPEFKMTDDLKIDKRLPEMTDCAKLLHSKEMKPEEVQDNRNSAPKIGHVKRLAAQLNINAACLRPPLSGRASTASHGSHVGELLRRNSESRNVHTANSATAGSNKQRNRAAAVCHGTDKTSVDGGSKKNQAHETKYVKQSNDVPSSPVRGKQLSVGRCLKSDEHLSVGHNSRVIRKDATAKVEKTERATVAAATSLTSVKKQSSDGNRKRSRLPFSKKTIEASCDKVDSLRCGSSVELSSNATHMLTKRPTNQQKQRQSVTAVNRDDDCRTRNSRHSPRGECHMVEVEAQVIATKKATSSDSDVSSKNLQQQNTAAAEIENVNSNSTNGGNRTDKAVMTATTVTAALKQTAEDDAVMSSFDASTLAGNLPQSTSPVPLSCHDAQDTADRALARSDVGTNASDDISSDDAKKTAWLLHKKWEEIVEGYATLVARTKLDRISNDMDISDRLEVLRNKTDQLILMSERADDTDSSSPTNDVVSAADSALDDTIEAFDRMSARFNEMSYNFLFGSTTTDGSLPTADDAKSGSATAAGDLTAMTLSSPTVGASKSTGVLPSADSAARRSIDGLDMPPGSTHSDKSFQQQQRARGNADVVSKRRDRFGRFPPLTAREPILAAATKDTVDCLRHCEGMQPEVLTRDDGDGDRLLTINAAPPSVVKKPQTAVINTRCDDVHKRLTSPRQLTAAESNQTSSVSTTSPTFLSNPLINQTLRYRREGDEDNDSFKMPGSAEIETSNRLRPTTIDPGPVKANTILDGRREAVVETPSSPASSTSSSSVCYSETITHIRDLEASSTTGACRPAFVTTTRNTAATPSTAENFVTNTTATSACHTKNISPETLTAAAGAASPATIFRNWLSTKLRGLQSDMSETWQVEPTKQPLPANSDDAEHYEQTDSNATFQARWKSMPPTKDCSDSSAKSHELPVRNFSLQRAATFQLPTQLGTQHQNPGTRSYSAADYEEMSAAGNGQQWHGAPVNGTALNRTRQGTANVGLLGDHRLLATGDHSAISRIARQDELVDNLDFLADTFGAESKTPRDEGDTEKHRLGLHLEQRNKYDYVVSNTVDDYNNNPDDDDDDESSVRCRRHVTNLITVNKPLDEARHRDELASSDDYKQPANSQSSEVKRVVKSKLTLGNRRRRKCTSGRPSVTVARRAPLMTGTGNDVKRLLIQRSEHLPLQSRRGDKNCQFIFDKWPLASNATPEGQCLDTVLLQSLANSDSNSSLVPSSLTSNEELCNFQSDDDVVQQSDDSKTEHLHMYQRSEDEDKRSTTRRGNRLSDDDVADEGSTSDDDGSQETESVTSSTSSSTVSDFYDVSSCRAEKLYDSEAEDLRLQIMSRLKGRCELLRLSSDEVSKSMQLRPSRSPDTTHLPLNAMTPVISDNVTADSNPVTVRRQYQQQSSNTPAGTVLSPYLPHTVNSSDVYMRRQRTLTPDYSRPVSSVCTTSEDSAAPQDESKFLFRMLYAIYVVCGCFTTGLAYLVYRQLSSVRSVSSSGRVAAAAVTALAPRAPEATNGLRALVYDILGKMTLSNQDDVPWNR